MSKMALAHLGYVVPDLDGALRRFVREGAVVSVPPTPDPIQKVVVCLLRIDEAVDVELVAPINENDCPIRSRLARGGGLDHLCYFVDDLAEAIAAEQACGALIVCQPCYAVAFRRRVAFVHRRSGLVVELMTRDEARPEGEQP